MFAPRVHNGSDNKNVRKTVSTNTSDRFAVIPNGYDDEDFVGLRTAIADGGAKRGVIRLLHSGVIYPDDRDPKAFFKALSRLKKEGQISANALKIDLRASGSETYYEKLLASFEISDIVRLFPPLPYRQALLDCANADGLLLLQAASCTHQIPAKAYEYLRIGKPILGLTPIDSDTGTLLSEANGATIIDLADEKAMFEGIPKFIAALADCTHPTPDANYAGRYSRRNQTSRLAEVFSELAGNGSE